MFEYIDKIRKKPKEVRLRFTLVMSGAITALIFAGWLMHVSSRMMIHFEDPTAILETRQFEGRPSSALTSAAGKAYRDFLTGMRYIHQVIINRSSD
jgi:hypothetical protein